MYDYNSILAFAETVYHHSRIKSRIGSVFPLHVSFYHVMSLIDLLMLSCNTVSHGFLPCPDTQGGLLGQEIESKIQEFGLGFGIFSADDTENVIFQQIAASIGVGSASNLLHCSIAICNLQRNLKPDNAGKHDAQQVLNPKLQVHG